MCCNGCLPFSIWLNKVIIRRFIALHRLKLSAAAFLALASAGATIGILRSIHILAGYEHQSGGMRVVILGVFLLFSLLFISLASQFVSANLGGQLIASFRKDVSRALINLNYERFASKKNIVFGSFAEDIHKIAPLVAMLPNLVYNFLIVLACSAYLFQLSTSLFFILGVGLMFPFIVYWGLGKTVSAKFDVMRQSEEGLFEQLRAISEGKKELVLSRQRSVHFTQTLLIPAIDKCEKSMTAGHLYIGIFQAWSSFAIYIVLFSVVYFGHFILKLPISTVVPFVVGGLYLTGPVSFLIQVNQQIAPGWASMRHLERLGVELNAGAMPPDASTRKCATTFSGWERIRADGLVYRFPSESEEDGGKIGPFNLDIRRGELLFIEGGNGAGKSTLLLMLCGLVSPTSGKIFVDGKSAHMDIESYRSLFCGVFSDFFLFKDIIGPGGENLPSDRFETLLRKMRLERVLEPALSSLPRLDFSTGQRKRLALLQCLAEDRDIYFFDEWAAEQDPAFRDYFYVSILPELVESEKTVIVISHDDRYFYIADRIVKIEGGRIVSETHPLVSRAPLPENSSLSELI